jgi:hypothetical protein
VTEPKDVDRVIALLLSAASLQPSPEELPSIAAAYRFYRGGADALYAVAGVEHEVPATAFDATPPPPRWEDDEPADRSG